MVSTENLGPVRYAWRTVKQPKEKVSEGKVEWPGCNCLCYLCCLETKYGISIS